MINTSDKLFNEIYKMLVEVMAIDVHYNIKSDIRESVESDNELSDVVVKRLKEEFGEIKINDIINIIKLDYRYTFNRNYKIFVSEVVGGDFVEKAEHFGRSRVFYDRLTGDYLDRIKVLKKRYF